MKSNHKTAINKLNIVISILIAFASWVYVVYNFAPMKDVTYTNIPISYVGEEDLNYQGLELKKIGEESVDVVLSIKRIDYNKITNDDISVVADVSDAIEGNNGISLDIVTPDGSALREISTKSVSVSVGMMKWGEEVWR